MKCLFSYQWAKLPRAILPEGKGVMGHWMKLACRAAFRAGKAKYCGHTNEVSAGTWAGGVVGLKSILKIHNRQKALDTVQALTELGLVTQQFGEAGKFTYTITDWVAQAVQPAADGTAVYATDGYGFICVPRSITQKLIDRKHHFEEADAWLDLWCHTAWQDPKNAFSQLAPVVQMGRYESALTLEKLGARWGWEKTKVWRFLQKHGDAFPLHKLPGNCGCLIFNMLYPTGTDLCAPDSAQIMHFFHEMRFWGRKTHFEGSENEKLNRFIAWYSKKLAPTATPEGGTIADSGRVALSLSIRAYLSHCENIELVQYDCVGYREGICISCGGVHTRGRPPTGPPA